MIDIFLCAATPAPSVEPIAGDMTDVYSDLKLDEVSCGKWKKNWTNLSLAIAGVDKLLSTDRVLF